MVLKLLKYIQQLVYNAQCHEPHSLYETIMQYYGTTGRNSPKKMNLAVCFKIGRCPVCLIVGLGYYKDENIEMGLIIQCLYCQSRWSIWTPNGIIVRIHTYD